MKNNKKNGFTLVELMVVIVSITILSGIAFVSYKGNTSKARDSKRTADITNIVNKMELAKIQGGDITLFIKDSSSRIADNISISGQETIDLDLNSYNAGDLDLVYLDITGEGFVDPLTEENYKGGMTSFQNRYEVAASMENDGYNSIITAGTWLPRSINDSFVEIDRIVRNTVYLSGATKSDLLLYPNDKIIIGVGSADVYTIDRIYDTKIELDRTVSVPGITGMYLLLNGDESDHLIKNWNSDFPIEKDAGPLFTPYDIQNNN